MPFIYGEVVCRSSVQIRIFLAALKSINYISLFMSGCFVQRMDKFLPQCVGRFKVNQDMMFTKHPPECSCDRVNVNVATLSCLLLSVCSGSFSGFDERTYLNQWLRAVPVKVSKALLPTSSM